MYGYVYRTLAVAVVVLGFMLYAAFTLIGTEDDAGRLVSAPALIAEPVAAPAPLPEPASQDSEPLVIVDWFDDDSSDSILVADPLPVASETAQTDEQKPVEQGRTAIADLEATFAAPDQAGPAPEQNASARLEPEDDIGGWGASSFSD